jgi:hypothetical protein
LPTLYAAPTEYAKGKFGPEVKIGKNGPFLPLVIYLMAQRSFPIPVIQNEFQRHSSRPLPLLE